MKDSGIPWLGQIPEHWEVKKIKRALKWLSIKGHGDSEVLALYRDHGVIPKDSRDDNHNVTSEKTGDYKFVEVGNFVINKMKAWQGSMAVSEYEGIVSPAYYVCAFIDNSIHKKYFHHLLRNVAYLPEYRRLSTGLRVGQWDLGFEDFRNTPFLLPPLPEQERIAEYLDGKCAEIDELISVEEQMIVELRAYKQSVITETVTRGLNPDAINNWKEVKVGHVCRLVNGYAFDSQDYKREGIPIIRISNIENNFINLNDCVYYQGNIDERFCISKGDLLMALSGATTGKMGVYMLDNKAYLNQRVGNLKVIDENILSCTYRNFVMQSKVSDILDLAYGGAQPNISGNVICNLKIPLPPLPEQERIAEYLDKKCEEIDALVEVKQRKIEELKEYRKSVIYEYVTGKREIV